MKQITQINVPAEALPIVQAMNEMDDVFDDKFPGFEEMAILLKDIGGLKVSEFVTQAWGVHLLSIGASLDALSNAHQSLEDHRAVQKKLLEIARSVTHDSLERLLSATLSMVLTKNRKPAVQEAQPASSDAVEAKQTFIIYWLDGKKTVCNTKYGNSINEALQEAGFGGGALAAIDFYSVGEDDNWEWSSKGQWVKKA